MGDTRGTAFATRLRMLRKQRGLTQRELADSLNSKQSTIAHYELGTRIPDWHILGKIAEFFNVSPLYLLGETDDPSAIAAANKELVVIPVLAGIPWGDPLPPEPQTSEWLGVPARMIDHGAQHFGLRVEDDAMHPARISEGDTVIVRRQDSCDDGQIAVVLWPAAAEAKLRRVYRREGLVILRSDHPDYPPEIVKAQDLIILGIVVGVFTRPVGAMAS